MANNNVIYNFYGYTYVTSFPLDATSEDMATDKEVKEAIETALNGINIVPGGEDRTYVLDVDGREAGEIVIPEDKYLDEIDTDDENREVTFKVVNGEDLTIPLDALDDPVVDGETF